MVSDQPEDLTPDFDDDEAPEAGQPARGKRIVRVYFARPAPPDTAPDEAAVPDEEADAEPAPPPPSVLLPGFDDAPRDELVDAPPLAEDDLPPPAGIPTLEVYPVPDEEMTPGPTSAPRSRRRERRRSPFVGALLVLSAILLMGLVGVAVALSVDIIPRQAAEFLRSLPLIGESPSGVPEEELSPGTGMVELEQATGESPPAAGDAEPPGDGAPVATEQAAGAIATMVAANATPRTPGELEPVIEHGGAEMVLVPGGTFEMGGGPAEPAHEVTLDAFYIDRYEVTQQQWQECVLEGACLPPAQTNGVLGEPYYGVPDLANSPIVNINWQNANAYCRWRGGGLPTEAQWEMAARWDPATRTVGDYPWGDEWDPARLNICDESCTLDTRDDSVDDGWLQMAPVDAFPEDVSPVGAYNMAGNVSEWTADWFAEDYYANSPAENPAGPESGAERVVRGGAWSVADPSLFDARSRLSFAPET